MTRRILCAKLKIEADALDSPPMPGSLGQKIYEEVSKDAWQQWLDHQTMLINENRLSMIDAKARAFLLQEMQSFLFGDGSAKPAGYIPK